MRWLVKTKAGRIVLGFVLSIAFLAFVGWKLMQPRIEHATLAEIQAVLPPEASQFQAIDEAAAERMDRILALAKGIHGTFLPERGVCSADPAQKRAAAEMRWKDHLEAFGQVRQLLAGGLQFRSMKPEAIFDVVTGMRDIVGDAAQAGSSFAVDGDYADAEEALSLANRLSFSFLQARCDVIRYLISVSLVRGSDDAVRKSVALPDCSQAFCRRLLLQLAPANAGASILAHAVLREFRDELIPGLLKSDSIGKSAIVLMDHSKEAEDSVKDVKHAETIGTYDPIETARFLGRVLTATLENARHPLSQYDDSMDRAVKAETSGLPDADGLLNAGLSWKKLKFTFLMNNTRNSLGRNYIAMMTMTSGKSEVIDNYLWRARREATRVLLATVLYRHDHAGKLPNHLADLVPKYLQLIPIDPFNGKPMLYNPNKQVVYSVGPSLIDHGGDIGVNDVGVSLKIGGR